MGINIPAFNEWEPLSPAEAAREFVGFPGLWVISGGWAIDLFLGEQTRSHADIDIQVDRRNAPFLHRSLPGWQFYLANHYLCEWAEGTPAPSVVSDIWCRRAEGPWKFQVMLGEFDDDRWYYRRDRSIHGPREEFSIDVGGLPVLAPEIQLLYKSNRPDLAKNEHDFLHALPRLGDDRRNWLRDALAHTDPGNPWLAHLVHP